MSITSILKKLFGDKSARDLKEIRPILQKVNDLRPQMEQLSNDELRANIDKVRANIAEAIAADQAEVDRLKTEVETLPFDKRQPLWDEIDSHEKNIIDTLEKVLNDSLPIDRKSVV